MRRLSGRLRACFGISWQVLRATLDIGGTSSGRCPVAMYPETTPTNWAPVFNSSVWSGCIHRARDCLLLCRSLNGRVGQRGFVAEIRILDRDSWIGFMPQKNSGFRKALPEIHTCFKAGRRPWRQPAEKERPGWLARRSIHSRKRSLAARPLVPALVVELEVKLRESVMKSGSRGCAR